MLFDQSNQLSRTTISCPVEGGFSVLISMADRAHCAGIEQQLASLDVDTFGMKRRDGGHERSHAVGSADGVDVGPPFEEIRDHLRLSARSGEHEARGVELVSRVDIEPGTEQLLDEIDTAPACGFADAVALRPADSSEAIMLSTESSCGLRGSECDFMTGRIPENKSINSADTLR